VASGATKSSELGASSVRQASTTTSGVMSDCVPGHIAPTAALKYSGTGVLVTRPRHTLRTGEVIIDAVADSRGAQVAAALGIDDPVQVWLDDEPKILPEIRFEVLWARAPEGACQR
jgi:hypothetical protein